MIITDVPHVTTKNQIVNALGYTPAGGQGVNLLTGTKDFYNSVSEGQVIFEKYNGFTVIHTDATSITPGYYYNIVIYENLQLEESEDYTVSFYAKGQGKVTCVLAGTEYIVSEQIDISSEWNRYKAYFKNVVTKSSLYLRAESGNMVDLCGVKLEPGAVTDPVWTPAPEDVVVRSELEKYFNTTPVKDLFEYADNNPNYITFVTTNGETLNTPHKANLSSGFGSGVALIMGGGSYITILFFCIGYHRTFIAQKYEGNWTKSWFEINFTENKIASSDESSDDMG